MSVLTLALVFGAVAVRRPSPSTPAANSAVVVRVAGSIPFFDDPEVQAALRRRDVQVVKTAFGSGQLPTVDFDRYDAAISASSAAVKLIKDRLGRQTPTYVTASSPLAIVSYLPIAELLRGIGVAEPGPNGTWIFHVRRYLDVVAAGMRWTDIPGNTVYRKPYRVLLTTTNPETSSSAQLFIAVAGWQLNGGDVVKDAATVDALAPRIALCFNEQGDLASSTTEVMNRYVRDGVNRVPIGLVYENDFLTTKINRPKDLTAQMILMYPDANVLAENTLVPFTPEGDRLGRLLTTDPELIGLSERKYGYRVTGPDSLSQLMAEQKIPVARDLDLIDPPTVEIMLRFVNAVKPK